MSDTARNLLAALHVAAETANSVPAMVQEFEKMPGSRRTATLDKDKLVAEYGQQNVIEYGMTTEGAPWRNHMVTRPALPQRTAVMLPEMLYVGPEIYTTLGYRYFHANRVWGGKFIATQTPVVINTRRDDIDVEYDTRADFWLAAYYHNVRAVVMLNRIEEAGGHAQYYFPIGIGETRTFYAYEGGVPVSILEIDAGRPGSWRAKTTVRCEALSELSSMGLQVRELSIRISVRSTLDPERTMESVARTVRHYYYLEWPDGGVMPHTQDLMKVVMRADEDLKAADAQNPVMVHCLAGHGRTGTFLNAVCPYYSFNPADGERTLSRRVVVALLRLRNERYFLVQNQLQFIYAFGVFVLLIKAKQQAGPDTPLLQSVTLVASKVGEATQTSSLGQFDYPCIRCFAQRGMIGKHCEEIGAIVSFCSTDCRDRFYAS